MDTLKKFLDGFSLLLGFWLLVTAWIWLPTGNALALWGVTILAAAVIIFAAMGEFREDTAMPEIANVILGALIFLSPWILSYTEVGTATWSAWIVGLALVVLEALAIPRSMLERTPHTPG